MPALATLCGHMEGGGKRDARHVIFFSLFERTISCYNEPEAHDFTKTETVDSTWLNLNLQGKRVKANKRGETQERSGTHIGEQHLSMRVFSPFPTVTLSSHSPPSLPSEASAKLNGYSLYIAGVSQSNSVLLDMLEI